MSLIDNILLIIWEIWAIISLDQTDRKILALLQEDASLPTAEIAKRVNLSLSPCWRRIKRLKDEGAIEREVMLVDQRKVGLKLTVFASVTLTQHSEENVTAFERLVSDSPEVTECHAVTGDRDYILRIVVPDIEDFERFLSQTLLHLPYITAVNSRFSLRRVKYSTALPLKDL